MVCFRYIILNTLHRGDNKDEDDHDNSLCHILMFSVINLFEKTDKSTIQKENSTRYNSVSKFYFVFM
jgi:hypothetical protein